MKDQPEYAKQEHFDFLEELRRSGLVNMWGARTNLMKEFPSLSAGQALNVLTYWMENY